MNFGGCLLQVSTADSEAGARSLEPEPPPRSSKEKVVALVQEYRAKVLLMPCRWKVVWALVLLLWAPLAYTVLALVPVSNQPPSPSSL
jgi:hypothetical protein